MVVRRAIYQRRLAGIVLAPSAFGAQGGDRRRAGGLALLADSSTCRGQPVLAPERMRWSSERMRLTSQLASQPRLIHESKRPTGRQRSRCG